MRVHLLVTVRKPELLPYSTLVFRTLRVGFPTADVHVHLNRVSKEALGIDLDSYTLHETDTTHHAWIKGLVETEQEPFWIVDTDLVLFDSVEKSAKGAPWILGWLIPEWNDEFTKTITRARLHTSLLYIDPLPVRGRIAHYQSKVNTVDFINPHADLFAPQCVAFNGKTYFYDVCAMLYHAIDGVAFTDSVKDKYFHFNFGTISDLVLPQLEHGSEMAALRSEVLVNPELGRGVWRFQEQYYADRQVVYDGRKIDETLSPEDMALARKWNIELCCGDANAMAFTDIWHTYVHLIDANIDAFQDGNPPMSKEQTIGIFFKAALLYNCPFFVAHRNLLFPIILDITNVYQLSVKWERSPQQHLRIMGDTFRTCGNRIYSIVALICGGEEHMLRMSERITERDWISQHDGHGNPT